MRRLTLDVMHERAALRGGQCLSTSYTDSGTKLIWQCAEGHTWEAIPETIKMGRWCPHCSHRTPLTLDLMHEAAAKRGGRCLSTAYVNSVTKLRWECSEGHTWMAVPNNVRNGRWCPTCGGTEPHTLVDMQALARERQGMCLSLAYRDARTPLRWRCSEGHEWEASATNLISHKSWCPTCAGQTRLTIAQMCDVARTQDGECLSSAYVNNRTKLRWRCRLGHEWDARPDHVLQGHWCSYCHDQTGEASCRVWLEAHFNRPFPKSNPEWLLVASGRKLQLDGYNESLHLAFEYQGMQHYRFLPWFHASPTDFEAQKQRDAEKAARCLAQGVRLIVVPYHARPVGECIQRQLGGLV